jgi:hypothetical protein
MYTANFIKARGQPCTILRTPEATSCVSMTLATRGYSDNRDLYREGLILADSNLTGGEVFTVESESFLTRSVYRDPQSGQLVFFASKVNATLVHKRYKETTDDWGNVTQGWETITATVYATARVVTAALLEKDPGLLPNTKWTFTVPATVPLQKMDRLEFADGTKCQVEDIDPHRLPGLLHVQCSDDLRGGSDVVPEPEEPEEPPEGEE